MSGRATRGGRAITEFLSQNEKAVFDRDSGHAFAPGFRLSLRDVTILGVGWQWINPGLPDGWRSGGVNGSGG
jgi:hypothetical protein